MDRSFFLRVIGQNLKDIEAQFNILRKNEGKIPQIELDIIMKNLQTVYEYFYQLEKVNRDDGAGTIKEERITRELSPRVEKSPQDPPPAERTVPGAGEPERKEQEKPPENKVEEPVSPPKRDTATSQARPVNDLKEEVNPAPKKAAPVQTIHGGDDSNPEKGSGNNGQSKPIGPENEKEKKVKNTADLFSDSGNTLADKLKSKDDTRVADKIQKSPVANLRNAIGINEKFLFLNELFGGKMKDYEEAIGKFENCGSLEESSRVLHSYKDQFNWSSESEAYQAFDNLLKRKFF